MPSYFCTGCKRLIVSDKKADPPTFKCDACLNSNAKQLERRRGVARRGESRTGGRRKEDK